MAVFQSGLSREASAAPIAGSLVVGTAQGVGVPFNATVQWQDDVADTGGVWTVTESGGASGSINTCTVTTNADGQAVTIVNATPPASDTCTIGVDVDTAAETTGSTLNYTCLAGGTVTFTFTQGGSSITSSAVTCAGVNAAETTITLSRNTVETEPVGESESFVVTTIDVEDASGNDVLGAEVNCIAPAGACEAVTSVAVGSTDSDGDDIPDACDPADTTPLQDEVATNSGGDAFFVWCSKYINDAGAEVVVAPGTYILTFVITTPLTTISVLETATIRVVGPPASLTITAAPTSLVCGEKATITGTVRDAIGQNVSDETPVLLDTNIGGVVAPGGSVIGGTGGTVLETSGGAFTGFLLTSTQNSGPYEVVASVETTNGRFISAQVTVTCSGAVAGAVPTSAAVRPPSTGTGITPPSTGDGGLADSSGSSWILLAGLGAVAFAFAGFASVKAHR
jgi:hypothetical protein